ncbi:pyridoxamine 5'-phosphate oxidase family protein [Winogradskya consettensis]|uniref:pyridoxamine 5'-phosphate oxidase family protein n=1 Tax=Winogradskya consettensis TaxID=113560 RepID=UPI001BB432CB|nr:pyridoxamine 5'-phosphate oxidase family protein [Actinoplanes consettensis]
MSAVKLHDAITGRLREFIDAQPMFFVATAPAGPQGHVNVSPKGMTGTFVVLGEHRVAYLDYHGSGAETIAHLRENGRITIMFCAFQGAPNIVRLYGTGRVEEATAEKLALFPESPDQRAVRAVIEIDVHRISDSCGYSVPFMSYDGDRDTLLRWSERKSDDDLADYRRKKNSTSIDGLPAMS